jgi:hypothetical protein
MTKPAWCRQAPAGDATGSTRDVQGKELSMQQMTRRTAVAVLLGCAAALATGLPATLAQESTPMPSVFEGYPVLDVSLTDASIDLATTEVPAGLIVLRVTNNSSAENGAAVLGPGPGQTMDDLQAAAATPTPSDSFPPFFYTATIAGGPASLQPGESAEALVSVPAGDWVVFCEGDQDPAFFSATEDATSRTDPPAEDIAVDLGDFYFGGLHDLSTGQQLWKVTNSGKQPHMMVVLGVPDGTTGDQVMATALSDMSGTPAANALQESDFRNTTAGVVLLSSGQTTWIPANLDAGTYVALCFVTDPETGQPHMMEGMYSIFTVGA